MLRLIGTLLRLFVAQAALKAALARAARVALLLSFAAACLAAAVGFGLFAAYAWLAIYVPPAQAAGICAGALLLLGAAAASGGLWLGRRRVPAVASMLPPEAAGVLEWGRANPLGAAAAALLLGFLAGRRSR
jgi:hypothetical protein